MTSGSYSLLCSSCVASLSAILVAFKPTREGKSEAEELLRFSSQDEEYVYNNAFHIFPYLTCFHWLLLRSAVGEEHHCDVNPTNKLGDPLSAAKDAWVPPHPRWTT